MLIERLRIFFFGDFLSVPRLLWAWMGIVCFFIVSICAVLYAQFQYAGLDLGIYNQVLWNTSQGRLFEFTFNEQSYLVDHREWLLILFVPIYWLIGHPFVLIVIQALIINSLAVPLYLLARKLFDNIVPHSKRVAFFVAAVALIHPTVLNMQLFEFHMLALTAPLAVWWWYGIVAHKRFRWIFFVVLLLMREDVAITTAAVGLVLLLTEKKRWKEAVVIVSSSVIWFGLMVWAGGYFSVEDNPLFFSLYAWMGESPIEAIQYIFLHPIAVLQHLLSGGNIFLLLLFLMSTAFFPLLAVRYFLPALFGLSVYFFMGSIEIGMDIFIYHYGVLIAVWTGIAALYGYRRLFDTTKKWRLPLFTQKDIQYFSKPIIFIVLFSSGVFFGIHWTILDLIKIYPEDRSGIHATIDQIPEDAAVMASDRVYPQLSSRQFLYSTKYIKSGLKHYSSLPYKFQPFDWLVVTDEVFRMQNGSSIQKKASSVKRLRDQIDRNNLVPVRLFEQGVLYGRKEMLSGPVVEPVHSTVDFSHLISVNQLIHPTARLDGYYYNNTTQQFSLKMTRLNNEQAIQFRKEYPDDQELFVRVIWRTKYHTTAATQYRLLGSATDPIYLWNDNESKVMQLPWILPDGATNMRLEFGSLYLPEQRLAISQTTPLVRQVVPEQYQDIFPILEVNDMCGFNYSPEPESTEGSCSLNTR